MVTKALLLLFGICVCFGFGLFWFGLLGLVWFDLVWFGFFFV